MSEFIAWLPWIAWLIAAFVWYSWLGFDTLARMLARLSGHWFAVMLVVLVYLMAAGHVGVDLGIPLLFRDDPENGFNQNSPAVWGAFSATILLAEVWIVVYLYGYIGNYEDLDPAPRRAGWDPLKLWARPAQSLAAFQDYRSALAYLAAVTAPFLLLLVLIGAFPAQLEGTPARPTGRKLGEALEYATGIALGALTVALMIRVGWWLGLRLGRIGFLRACVARTTGVLRTNDLPMAPDAGLPTAMTASFWIFLAVFGGSSLIPMNWPLIVPSLAISVLLGLIVAGYFVLITLRRSFQLPAIVLLIAYVSWSNGSTYKYQFPRMGSADKSLYARGNLCPPNIKWTKEPPAKPLLDNETVLNAWKKRLGDKKPKLVLVVVSGGAYRAGFWTAAVLDELTKRSASKGELEGLADRIRLISGASGGMVGAAYFQALRGQKPTPNVVDKMIAETHRDSLTPVIQQMVQRDIPMVFSPTGYQAVDRGVVLDDQWVTLARPFADSYEREQDGSVPSLIVSPMVVETGERMLISNLQLRDIANPQSIAGTPYLSSARQFFQMFPAAQPTFHLSTAIRMSATFPYVSPAVSLPCTQPRRVVDAGYYDNYGVNIAAAWAYQNQLWIRANTSGVAMIQIIAYPRSSAAGEIDGDDSQTKPATVGDTAADTTARSFTWLSSPIEGALGARNWSMLYRNEEQLRLLDDTFNQPEVKPRLFESFVFTNPGNAALNWIVPLKDIQDMKVAIAGDLSSTTADKSNKEQMDRLTRWWKGESSGGARYRAIAAPDRPQQTQFEASPTLTPKIKQNLDSAISDYRKYMIGLGFVAERESVKVSIGLAPDQVSTAHYTPLTNTIMIGEKLANIEDDDVAYREYTHHTLIGQKDDSWLADAEGIESGLADYFPCSYKNSPKFGEKVIKLFQSEDPGSYKDPYLRNIDNKKRFDELGDNPERHDEGEVWGGAFWDLRQVLGKDTRGKSYADLLLFKTAQNFQPTASGKTAWAEFVRELLGQEKQLTRGELRPLILKVFADRGLQP